MNLPPEFLQQLGAAIRMYRKSAGLTQAELAEAAGVTRRFLQELENARSDISLGTLYKLSRSMDTSLTALCAEIERSLNENLPSGE